MRNILITTSSFGKFDSRPLDLLRINGLEPILNPYGRKLTVEETNELISLHQPIGMIAGVESLNAVSIGNAKNLQVISRCGIGMDNVDLAYAKVNKIAVFNTPEGPTIAVAELTLGLILTLLRRIHVADASIRSGHWDRPMGNLLHKKIVAVIGCGRIGKCLIDFLEPFGCKVYGVDPYAAQSEKWTRVELDVALTEADIVTLHLPYNEENHHYLNKDNIKKMKTDSILINASRGGLIDEDALFEALSNTQIRGAALDCFEIEPYVGPLTQLDNVLLSGHIGSYAIEGRIGMEVTAVENIVPHIKVTTI